MNTKTYNKRRISSSKSNILADLNDMESEFEVVNYMKKVFDEHGKPELYEKFCEEVDNSDDVPGVVAEKYVNKIFNSRRISSSQKGMENVAEGTKYDDYHIDTRGQAILDVEYIIDSIESRGNQAVLTIQCSDGTNYHTYVPLEDWKEFKDLKNNSGVAITDVWVTEVEGGSYIRNSRQIKSSVNDELYKYLSKKTDCTKTDDYIEFPDDGRISDKYLDKFVDKYNVSLDYKRTGDTMIVYLPQSRQIKSARYIATDPESGEVLGSADTYEEAVNQWGEDVTITDSEAAEGQEEGGLFSSYDNKPKFAVEISDYTGSVFDSEYFDSKSEAIEWANSENHHNGHAALYDNEDEKLIKEWEITSSRKIISAVDGGWEVRSSDVPEALDLFVEYFGEEDALEEIAKAMGDNTLEENIDYIAQQWGFAEDIEELDDAWDKYETAKEIMGESELFNNLTQAAGYDELAEDLAFIFRMNDFREWDKYDNEDDDEISDDKISDDDKEFALYYLLSQIYGDDMAQPVENAIYDADGSVSDITDEYESEGGEYTDDEYPEFDDTELATKIVKNFIESHDIDISAIQPEPSEITNNCSFPVKTVKNILSGKWSEDYAAECIAQKQNINVGYAKQILSSWIEQYKPKLIKSGILDIAEDINAEFDIDGDLESWAEQYTNPEGKSNTVGGEMVRAAMQIIYRYNNDGDMIGRGYGNETVNAAARYITEKAEMGVNEQIQKWLDHEERADDYDYDNFIQTFTSEIEQILRENPELFQKPNKDDYWSYKIDDDLNYGFDECYITDSSGNEYWFQENGGDVWNCTGIETTQSPYSEGDTIYDGDEYSDEIDHTEEFGSFEAEGFIIEYAGDDWNEETEQYNSWQVTKVIPDEPFCDEGDNIEYYDLEPDSLYGFRLYDRNGNEIDERTFLANSLIKSAFFAGDEGEVIIEINNNGKWEFVSLDNTPQGWSTKKNAKVFKSKDAARSSALMKRLEQAGYSEDAGNLRISVH